MQQRNFIEQQMMQQMRSMMQQIQEERSMEKLEIIQNMDIEWY